MAPTCRTRRTKGAVTSSRRHHSGSSSPHGAALPPGMNSIPEQRVRNECSARVKAVLASPLPCDSRRRAPCCRRVHPPADSVSVVRPGPPQHPPEPLGRGRAALRQPLPAIGPVPSGPLRRGPVLTLSTRTDSDRRDESRLGRSLNPRRAALRALRSAVAERPSCWY